MHLSGFIALSACVYEIMGAYHLSQLASQTGHFDVK